MDHPTKPMDLRSLLQTVDCALGEAPPGPGPPPREMRPSVPAWRIFSSQYCR